MTIGEFNKVKEDIAILDKELKSFSEDENLFNTLKELDRQNIDFIDWPTIEIFIWYLENK